MLTHTLGFPRIGANRELKKAQEDYWKGEASQDDLYACARQLRLRHWRLQAEAGVDLIPVGDFSLYDHMLDASVMFAAIPARFEHTRDRVDLPTYFHMARGRECVAAMEMSKWFNTNYHYIVPEFEPGQVFSLHADRLLEQIQEAKQAGFNIKPVIVGPLTYLKLGKSVVDDFDPIDLLDRLLPVYEQLLNQLAQKAEWIQIDEPVLVLDLNEKEKLAFRLAYERLVAAAGSARILLATYFETLAENMALASMPPVAALHVDLSLPEKQLDHAILHLKEDQILSLGIVNGRNVWRVDAERANELIRRATNKLGEDRVMIGTSCSLLHTPVDLDQEDQLDTEIKPWLAFAKQKCSELRMLADYAIGVDVTGQVKENDQAWQARRHHPRAVNAAVRERIRGIDQAMLKRNSVFPERKLAQQQRLNLPPLPTTTIGSFPQTADIRRARRQLKAGEIDEASYTQAMQSFIGESVEHQNELGLDVLVHGEPERNDMVEYFGEQLDGFCFTRHGWVQSYGSRCVKPPILFGDVSRPKPMTVEWARFAQTLTNKPMKGMLTGPVTIMCWSFVRDDQPLVDTCMQIALAIRDEVIDLEIAGLPIIQVDEAALREGLPLRRADWDTYLKWATDCFKLAVSGLRDDTQLHTHMCYSEFNDIVEWIAQMDADVVSIEASRSKMELLRAFDRFNYPNDIGPGIYDIHSPRVPSEQEMAALITEALDVLPAERLWVNPDCGLKTRDWPETLKSLRNMVAAAHSARESLQVVV